MSDGRTSIVIPNAAEARHALLGGLSDSGHVRVPANDRAPPLREWTREEARKELGLTQSNTAWVTSAVGDPHVFAENERRKILAVLGDISHIELLWNRCLLAVWVAPEAKDLGGGTKFFRSSTARDEDVYQGQCGLLVAAGPTFWVKDFEENEDGSIGDPIYFPQRPKIGDWVAFQRGYGTKQKINDLPLVLIDKETEAIKMILPWPHAIDIT